MKSILKSFKRVTSLLIALMMIFNLSVIVSAARSLDASLTWTENFEEGSWADVADASVFTKSDFEPGSEIIRYFKIANTGSLAFSYDFKLKADAELGSLAGLIDVYYLDNVTANTTIAAMTKIGTLNEVVNGNSVLTGKMLPSDLTGEGFETGEKNIAVALRMQDGVSSDYMDMSLKNGFYVTLVTEKCDFDYPLVDKFKVKLPEADFLYRVGNVNNVLLTSLFEAIDGADIGNVAVTVKPLDESASATGTFIANSDWTKASIDFNGAGPVEVTITDDDYAKSLSLKLEVIDAKNVTTYSELSNTTCVLLSDITMSSGSFYLSNATLYGNGFTFDVTKGDYSGTGKISSNYLVSLSNACVDNVKIVGAVYTQYGAQAANDYNRATVLSSGNNIISNSYISNCASPVRVTGGNVKIINSTLKGGNFANLDIRNGNVELDNVTTINQANSNDTATDGTVVVGLGVVVYYENVLETTTVDVKNGITQYNHLSDSEAEQYITDTTAKKLVSKMFDSEYSAVQYSDGNTVYVNAGILSMSENVDDDNITDVSGYSHATPSIAGASGYLHTKVPTAESIATVAPDYVTLGQYSIAPSYSFDYTNKNYVAKIEGSNDYCYYDEDKGEVTISMDDGDTFTWDTSILTATKVGKTLDYTVSMNGTDYTGKTIAFNADGDYVVTYTYTDANNYDIDENGNITTYSKTYTKNVNISVSVKKADTKNAEFTFGSSNQATEKITVGDKTYISATGVSDNNSTWSYITVDGTKIYYPIVEAEIVKFGNTQAFFYVFKDVVTITDYADGGTGAAVTYNSETTTMPSGLTVVKGKYDEFTAISSDWSTLNDTQLNLTGASNVFKYAASDPASETPTTRNSKLCYESPSGLPARVEYYTLAQYSYTDEANTTYYYYVGYHMANQKSSSSGTGCLADGTLITLADGTQKKIEEVQYEDELLAWDFVNGEYTTVPSSLIINDGDDEYTVITLEFDDGTDLRIVDIHGLFDADLNKFVYIDPENVESYLGHNFVKTIAGEDGKFTTSTVKLVDFDVATEYSGCYTVQTALHINCIADNMLTQTPPLTEGWFDYFEMGDFMKYDEEKMQADIEKYGLYTYEDFEDYLTYDAFIAFNGPYLKVAVGKGYFDIDYLIEQIKAFGIGTDEDDTDPAGNTNAGDEEKENTGDSDVTVIADEDDGIAPMSETTEVITAETITSGLNTISTGKATFTITASNATATEAGYKIDTDEATISLTLSGVSKGYAVITVDGDKYYTASIENGTTKDIIIKNAKGEEITIASYWGTHENAAADVIDLGEFFVKSIAATETGADAVIANTTKYDVENVNVYIAVYNKATNQLVAVNTEKVTVKGGEEYPISVLAEIPESYEIKAFVWDDGMKPIIK